MPAPSIQVVCPNCQAKMKAPAIAAGRKAKCPRCKSEVQVPLGVGDEPAPSVNATHIAQERPTPPAPPPPVRPAIPETAESKTSTPARPRRAAIWVGAVALGVFAVLGLAVTLTRGGKAADSSASSVPAVQPVAAPNPATQAKDSFAALTDRVAARFFALPKEALPAATKFDWDFESSLDTTVRGEIGPDPFTNLSHDVRETGSLVTPYRGLIAFGAKFTGEMTGTITQQTSYRFDFDMTVSQDGVAEYGFRDGRWRLVEVRLTVKDSRLLSREAADKNLLAALTANELNKKQPVVGKTTRLDASNGLGLVKLFREAEGK